MVPNAKQQNQENNFYLNLLVFNTKKKKGRQGGTDSLGDWVYLAKIDWGFIFFSKDVKTLTDNITAVCL